MSKLKEVTYESVELGVKITINKLMDMDINSMEHEDQKRLAEAIGNLQFIERNVHYLKPE